MLGTLVEKETLLVEKLDTNLERSYCVSYGNNVAVVHFNVSRNIIGIEIYTADFSSIVQERVDISVENVCPLER
jgi:hypothetical protein